MHIDLHTHSTCSDGTDQPAALMYLAAQAHLDVIALTDHDTVTGWDKAAAEVSRSGVALVRGAEFSTSHDLVTAHVLGLLFDPRDEQIQALFRQVKISRVERLKAMTHKLAADYRISWEQVLAQVPDQVAVGRPHLADALIKVGYFPNREEAFRKVLHPSSPYYVRYQSIDTVKVVRTITQAGGTAIFAHPRVGYRQRRFLPVSVIRQMKEAGLRALEVEHPEQTALERAQVANVAQELGLLQTGASDYHGRGKANRLGECLTDPAVFTALTQGTALPVLYP